MNTIKVITELCEEDRKRIDELIAFAGLLVGELKSRPAVRSCECEPQVDQTPAADPIVEEPTQKPAHEVEPLFVSLAEFQKAVTMAVAKGAEAKKATKAIINKYAESVSEVPVDKRIEIMAELANI